jgi:hypothetical protein
MSMSTNENEVWTAKILAHPIAWVRIPYSKRRIMGGYKKIKFKTKDPNYGFGHAKLNQPLGHGIECMIATVLMI